MTEFKVDTNSMAADGTIVASRRRVSSAVTVGETVQVTDIADMKRYSARVNAVSERVVELKIDLASEMLPLDAIDSLTESYFRDVPMPRLLKGAENTGSASPLLHQRQLLQGL